MGKNYVENSLKRFLKRKVKITLGVVVSFLITGAVAFAREYNVQLNPNQVFGINGEEKVKIDENFKISENSKLEMKKEDGTTEDVWGGITAVNGVKIENYASLGFYTGTTPGGAVSMVDSEFHNYGNVIGALIWNSKFYNYGTVTTEKGKGKRALTLSFKEDGKDGSGVYNFGYIIGSARVVDFNGKTNNSFYNFGTIKVRDSYLFSGGNHKDKANENFVINNGVGISSYNLSEGNKVLNIKNNGMFISTMTTFNHLVIKNYKKMDNRGAFIVTENGQYKLRNTGTGIIGDEQYNLTNNNSTDDKEILKSYGTAFDIVADFKDNNKTEYVLNSENIKQTATINGQEITKEADNIYINNASFKLDLGTEKEIDGKKYKVIDNKVITTIYQGGGNGVVLDNNTDGDKLSGNLNLALNDTTIVGYFEKNGTLLKVDGYLTLTGNSIINAVAARDEQGNILEEAKNVVAVDVFGKLTYTEGESHIFGTIKGGEGSKIVVNGTETTNPNELTETLSSSGNIYLNGQKWTKGETGSIELTGGTVHIDNGNGTLVGYLFGDNQDGKTTLDGMITGKGTLNVNEIRFDLGNLEINNMEDTYKVNGNKDIAVQDALNKINVSGIFNKKTDGNGNLILSLKSAEEMGIHDPSKQKEYEELVKNFKDSEEFYNLVNTGNAEAIRKYLNVLDKVMELLGTAGVKITRDLTGAFTDAVVEFDKKANKGEWLTNAKYIGSDMEYDGTKHINGYDSDIKSMIGMAEYGITENTSLGFALGGGDTEVDLKTLNGKSTSFDGKNYYAGIYAKHSMNGFDMIGSLGYTISDLDVEKGGSADSEAITLAGYIKKDVYVTDTVKLEPNLSFTYDYIMQDKAEMGEGMTIDSGDSHVFEAGAGLNLVKEFALEKGSLKLKTGVKYSMTNIERNKDVTGKFYNADVNLGSPDIDDKEGKAHVGFDYEHETGFGVNGKYEMMWSDSGDDSRLTAGISYRF